MFCVEKKVRDENGKLILKKVEEFDSYDKAFEYYANNKAILREQGIFTQLVKK